MPTDYSLTTGPEPLEFEPTSGTPNGLEVALNILPLKHDCISHNLNISSEHLYQITNVTKLYALNKTLGLFIDACISSHEVTRKKMFYPLLLLSN